MNTAPPKVSVIVPVYNAGTHLAECIESLLAQSLRECQFIFVNDGSRDESAAILEAYQSRDSRIKVIHQPNGGVSAARNRGLAAAEGEFLGFVDADDCAAPDLYETLYTAAHAESCDIVFSGYVQWDGERENVMHGPFLTGTRLDRAYLREWVLPVFVESDGSNSVCSKLFRRDIIAANGLTFPQGVALGEDGLFNMRFLCYADSGICLDYAGYYYRERAGSATRRAAVDYFARTIEVYEAGLPEEVVAAIGRERLGPLKINKFVRNAVSIIHQYYGNATEVPFAQKYRYVSGMLKQGLLREALESYKRINEDRMGSYERLLISLMQLRQPLLLYGLTTYSSFRSR